MKDLAGYKEAYEGLARLVKVSGNELLIETVEEINEALEKNKTYKEKNTSNINKEEFEAMGYSERVKFKAEYPEEYKTMIGGR